MKHTTNVWTYEKYDLSKLNDSDLEKFWRIIQETWSFFFWEYLKCNDCWNIQNKEDVYKHYTNDYSQYTIEELEALFTHDFTCWKWNCNGSTSQIWWNDFMRDLEFSLTQNISANLVTFKNRANEIVGIWYSYINSLRKIYEQDLYFDFPNEIENNIQFQNRMNQNFIIPTGLSIIEREKSFNTVMTIWKFMMMSYQNEYNKLPWILASLNWSATNRAYIKNWAIQTWVTSPNNSNIQLLTQENMIWEYKKRFAFILEKNPYTPSY